MMSKRIKTFCSSLSGPMAGKLAVVQNGLRQGHDTTVSRSAAVYCPVSCRFALLISLCITLFTTFLLPVTAFASSNGDRIINRATFISAETPVVTSSVTVTVVLRTPSTVEFLKYAPGASGATSLAIAPTGYLNDSGSFITMAAPVTAGSRTVIDLTAPAPLLPYNTFHAGEPLFIRVIDPDQNLDRGKTETIIVNLSDPKTGDSETLQLSETGPDTGRFIGWIQTAPTSSLTHDGQLSVIQDSAINARYVDSLDGSDSSAAACLVDPFGIVFDTVTGRPVDGARVELLNADGSPATVYGDNGLASNIFPNSVISGSTTRDMEGNGYSFTPGGYRFPFVNPGSYTLKVTPPDSYSFPSRLSTTEIQKLPDASFTILDPGSRGEPFIVPTGPAIRIDIPLDPRSGTLWISKSAGKSSVSSGDFLSYDVTCENSDPLGTVNSATVIDRLPPGFRYQKGSARLNGLVTPDPTVSLDGSSLTFKVGTIGPKDSARLRYITLVGAGAKPGTAVNFATAIATPAITANTASAAVTVQEPFMQSRNIVMGRVFVGACSDNDEDLKKGMEGIGIYLEDGTFVISDKRGMFHFEGVRSGSHVVQLDLDSIPDGYKIQPCEQNSRFAGRAYSQFVDLQGGTMWRTDFHLGKISLKPPVSADLAEKSITVGKNSEAVLAANQKKVELPTLQYRGEISLEMISSQSGEFIDYRIPLQTTTVPLSNLQLLITLPPCAIYVKGSSRMEGAIIPDPEITGTRLGFKLGSAGTDWQKELRFRVIIDLNNQGDELQTKGLLTFDSPTVKSVNSPEVENLLSIVKEESLLALPAFIVRPMFPTFGAELDAADRKQLDELAQLMSRFKIDRIDVTGHTDLVRISPRSRHIYSDNTALSFARARSVGRYLTAALHLPPEKLNLSGNGERSPMATNRSAAGRALNRRVEVKVSASKIIETTHLKIIKERSGVQKQETSGEPVRPPVEAPPLLTRPAVEEVTHSTQTAGNPAGILTAESNSPVPAAADQGSQVITAAVQKKVPQSKPDSSEERAVLYSGVNDGIVHYRVMLKNIKDSAGGVSATLIMPDNLLYMSGTTQLGGANVSDPAVDGSILKYSFTGLTEEKRFDLRLQALLDGDLSQNKSESMVSVVISDALGKPVKTFSAKSELSGNMEEITRPDTSSNRQPSNRPDLTPAVGQPGTALQSHAAEESLKQGDSRKSGIEDYHERVEISAGSSGLPEATGSMTDKKLHVREEDGIQAPADGTYLATQHNSVRVVLGPALKPVLLLDGQEISPERIGFSMEDKESDKTLYVYMGIDFGDTGPHTLQLKGLDPLGVTRLDKTARVTRTGEITAIRLVSAEGNIADGRTPVKVRVQLLDKEAKPVSANAELTLKGGDLRPLSVTGSMGLDAGSVTVVIDSEGWVKFQPVTTSGLYRVQISYNKATLDLETYVKPKMRDWILVGLAEGTVGYRTATGHMENLKATGEGENLYEREKVAFYAKGTIKGEWLLTMSYDSAKSKTGLTGDSLFQTIDPNSYYTLYGDATNQRYDAASKEKLFLKIERDQFYGLFGDFTTGLTVTELSRYNRNLNGVKTEFRSKDYELTAFGSETGQTFVKDEIRGDGTSGLYRLSRKNLVSNSDKITIETRERFHSEIITNSRQMNRFIDYSIDYDAGTIFFKSPVASKDELLNPVYIVADYEIVNGGRDSLTYGGHAGTSLLDGALKLGGTHIHEGHISGSSNLYGADAALTLGPGTKARAEFAATENDTGAIKTRGSGYLAEISHSGKTVDARLYYREQENGFGLGQQQSSESGSRKVGAEAAFKLGNNFTLSSQGYRQNSLTTGTVRDFLEVQAGYSEKQFSARTGLRYAKDSLTDGSSPTSTLGTLGGSWKTANQKLTLRLDHEQALFGNNSNIDFPTRTVLGADYQIAKEVQLYVQEELTYGEAADTNATRVGIKATPWTGGTISSAIVNNRTENSDRTFANLGLAQKWQLNPRWTVDGGLDHNETVRKKTGYQLSPSISTISASEEFTAISIGANYQEKKTTWSNRGEYRTSESGEKWGVTSGLVHESGVNLGWSGKLQLFQNQESGGVKTTNADLRLGLAYRPPVTRWILLDRLDLILTDEKGSTSLSRGRRIINNLNANWRPDKKSQLSLQYGAKYVLERLDGGDYGSFTDLVGFEGRYDLTREWDLGIRGSILHSWSSRQISYSFGPSVGYNLMENAWLSLGYNLLGFQDSDFSSSNYSSKGPFMQFRYKFDQNSVRDAAGWLNKQ